MANPTISRFEWLKAVLQAEGLTPTAKNVASALAVQFANSETGQLNPSQETLADFLKVHKDTVKRVLRELRNAGWLLAIGSGGRSKAPLLRLLTPGKIVPFRASKRGGNSSQKASKRGGDMCVKGGQINPSHYKEEQSLEQRGDQNTKRRVSRPHVGIRNVYETEVALIDQWNAWLAGEGLPKLQAMHLRSSDSSGIFFEMPWRFPPSDLNHMSIARMYFLYRIQQAEAQHDVA